MNNNTIFCQSYNKTFTTANIDEFGCRIINFAAILFANDFGYYSMGPLLVIVVISIFGKIQGSYRWLLLYQAIWDLLCCSYYSCNNLLVDWVKKAPQCFFMTRAYTSATRPLWMNVLDQFFGQVVFYNSYSALLLLSASRFVALYYPLTYKKIFQGRRILFTIVIFTFFSFLFDLNPFIMYLQTIRYSQVMNECMLQQNISSSLTTITCLKDLNIDTWYNFFNIMTYVTLMLQHFKPPLFLLLSAIFAILTFWKIAKQAKFQSQHNPKDFSTSLRIAIVMGLQIFLNCFVVFLEILKNLFYQLVLLFEWKIITARTFFVPGRSYTDYWDFRLPLWLDGGYGLSSDSCRFMIIQFRILFESFIILIILTEYRRAVVNFMKFIYNLARHPLTSYENLNQTVVIKLSQN